MPRSTALPHLLTSLLLATAALAQPNLGPNTLIFDPSMPTAQIQAAVDAVAAKQVSNQFGPERYALLFKPGIYGADTPLILQVGFYTDVAGLGASPTDVTINGHVDSYNQCFPTAPGAPSNCTALDNFWRSVSNLTINVAGLPNTCRGSGDFWAVSQASPIRRVAINNGNLVLFDYCTAGPQYASGGFLADSAVQYVINGPQQQFFTRNATFTGWSNAVWNQVFAGVPTAPAQSYPNPAYTTLTSTPVSREKPFLTVDAAGNYSVFVPDLQRDLAGPSWSATVATPGKSLPISRFFIADPSTRIEAIDEALLFGKDLLLTPGVYHLPHPIIVERPDTVILGLGLATLVPTNGNEAITVADVSGVHIAGLILDAGPQNSPVLLKMGFGLFGFPLPRGGFFSHVNNPSTLSDVYFRIGGATPGKATTSLEVDSSDVILDNIWAWRADHGNGVGWTLNTADHGLVINGDRVTATGLAVEHYQKEQVLWNGNSGETIFYQSELPYDVPNQAAWTRTLSRGTASGYPSYVVSDLVNTHQLFGSGIYSNFTQGVFIVEDNAMTVPDLPGIAIHDTGTVFLSGTGQISHVVNKHGATANQASAGQLRYVVSYP